MDTCRSPLGPSAESDANRAAASPADPDVKRRRVQVDSTVVESESPPEDDFWGTFDARNNRASMRAGAPLERVAPPEWLGSGAAADAGEAAAALLKLHEDLGQTAADRIDRLVGRVEPLQVAELPPNAGPGVAATLFCDGWQLGCGTAHCAGAAAFWAGQLAQIAFEPEVDAEGATVALRRVARVRHAFLEMPPGARVKAVDGGLALVRFEVDGVTVDLGVMDESTAASFCLDISSSSPASGVAEDSIEMRPDEKPFIAAGVTHETPAEKFARISAAIASRRRALHGEIGMLQQSLATLLAELDALDDAAEHSLQEYYAQGQGQGEDPSTCQICYLHQADCRLLPCAHALCQACVQRLSSPLACPFDRIPVSGVQRPGPGNVTGA